MNTALKATVTLAISALLLTAHTAVFAEQEPNVYYAIDAERQQQLENRLWQRIEQRIEHSTKQQREQQARKLEQQTAYLLAKATAAAPQIDDLQPAATSNSQAIDTSKIKLANK